MNQNLLILQLKYIKNLILNIMGIRNFFQELNNPYIVDSFNDLYDNHYKALEMFCYDTYANDYKRYLTICLNQASGSYSKYHRHQMPSRQSDFETKKWFVDMKEHILDSYREDQEFRELKRLIEYYPFGVADVCYNKYSIAITDVRHLGEKKSLYQRREEARKKEAERKKKFETRERSFIEILGRTSSFRPSPLDTIERSKKYEKLWQDEKTYIEKGIYKGKHSEYKYDSEGCLLLCLRTLCNFNELLTHKHVIESRDGVVQKKLKEEDKKIVFEDKILLDDLRAQYYKEFCKKQSVKDQQIHSYCLHHLNELDAFVDSKTKAKSYILKVDFPFGVEYYCLKHFRHEFSLLSVSERQTLISDKNQVMQYDKQKPRDNLTQKVILLLYETPEGKKRREEEERKKREKKDKDDAIYKARYLANYYSLGFKHYFPNISSGSIDYPTAKSILWKEMQIKDWSEMLRRISTWDNVKGIPYYFFWYYYPTRFSNVSYESERARKLIWNFKDGKPTDLSIERIIINKLRSTFGSSILKELSFVCIPASSAVNNNIRYKYFSENVCKELGMMNAFPKIKIIKDKTPAHLSPTHTAEPAEYSFDTSFFRGANIILFDDVITTGHSMAEFKRIFERQLGAHVICAISIGRTYSDYNGEQRKPHPYTGTL